MNNSIYKIIKPLLIENSYELINSVKILLFKENQSIFELLDFNDETIYLDPFIFMYVKNRKQTLDSVIIGYTKNDIDIEITTDEFGRIYIPNIGWLHTSYKETCLRLRPKKLKLSKNGRPINFKHEPIYYIKNTKIELLKYSLPSLKPFYCDSEGVLFDVEIQQISNHQIPNITKAYNLIKTNVPTQFELIEEYAPKCVIFNIDSYKRNSFATFAANGICFFNAYQDDYNEVFFIDDIAHQSGHVIFNTVTYDITKFLKISSTTILETINLPSGIPVEKRSVHIVFHALYTYYTTFICLDACISNNAFEKKQQHEAIGRIAFYLNKCYNDLLLIDNPISSEIKSNLIFTKIGLKIYKEIKNKWSEIFYKWHSKIVTFDMTNQPYNFTYSKFLELNPLTSE